MSAISNATQELIEKLEPHAKVDNATGAVTGLSEQYEANLPTPYKLDDVKAIRAYDTRFAAAATHVAGHGGVTALDKNGELKEFQNKVEIGPGLTLTLAQKRSDENTNPRTLEKSTVYGGVTAKLTFDAFKGSAGDLKKVRDGITARGLEALSK